MGIHPEPLPPHCEPVLCHAARMGDGGWDAKNSGFNIDTNVKVLNFVKELTPQKNNLVKRTFASKDTPREFEKRTPPPKFSVIEINTIDIILPNKGDYQIQIKYST